MNIYVDFDDCLCETARHFSGLVKEMFNLDIPYEQIHYFNLQKSFDLTDQQYDEMMIKAHQPEILLSYDETPGASKTINSWLWADRKRSPSTILRRRCSICPKTHD